MLYAWLSGLSLSQKDACKLVHNNDVDKEFLFQLCKRAVDDFRSVNYFVQEIM